ncbi:acyl-homoserine-lactone synthase [Roseinatronobacter bogoriensis]|nr:acyl-homoserine-lactone synthase [Rhodobaca bogoriensis]
MKMILVVDALNKHVHGGILDEMFRLRARVFGERLGWDVKIEDGREIDEFDHLDPAYVIGLDEDDNVVACVRALQTTGPHMLADVFSDILQGQAPLRSATLWESTRFCVDTDRLMMTGRGAGTVSLATCELMVGSLEYARASGIEDIITVIDPVMNRVLKRSDNAPYDYVGATVQMGKTKALAALLDCSEERIARVRAFAGIEGDVFVDEDALSARRALRAKAASMSGNLSTEVLQYLIEQLDAATTEHEVSAALALAEQLVGPGNEPSGKAVAAE